MNNEPKILVVDDEINVIKFLSSLLLNAGYQIIEAYDGKQALIVAEQELPDLIILNVVMPRMDGFEACRSLKSNKKTNNIPIIFLTGKKDVNDIIQGYDLGADHYVTKPFHPGVFLAQLKMSLKREGYDKLANTVNYPKVPKVFISYKWESDNHNNWVMNLAVNLRSAGIEAYLDQWEVRLGDSFSDYMTSKINEADVVLFVMTSESVSAVEARENKGGAVKFEMQLATSRKIAGENFRIIPIYREGSNTVAHIRDHRYADFRDDSKYEYTIQMLAEDILGIGPKAPPVKKR